MEKNPLCCNIIWMQFCIVNHTDIALTSIAHGKTFISCSPFQK
uniref:Uncharacterized protein n=1 Tax=Anguilla anguilla TaxID=7936 RepID=A0A0E9VG49_ANGAN